MRNVPGKGRLYTEHSRVIVLLGRFVSDVSKIRSDGSAAIVNRVAGTAVFLRDQLLGLIDVVRPFSFAVVAMTGVTVDLHHRSSVLYQVKIAHLFAHQRFFPVLDKPMCGFHVGSKTLPAVTDRAAILTQWMFL